MEYTYHTGEVYVSEKDEKAQKKAERRKLRDSGEETFMLLQTVLCVIIIIIFILLRAVGGKIYETAKDFYNEMLGDSITITEKGVQESFSELFGEKSDDKL